MSTRRGVSAVWLWGVPQEPQNWRCGLREGERKSQRMGVALYFCRNSVIEPMCDMSRATLFIILGNNLSCETLHNLCLLLELQPIHRGSLIVSTLSGMSSVTLKICLSALHPENTLAQEHCGSRVQEFMTSRLNISNFAWSVFLLH